ncbi:MAG: acyl carrier protein [Magnetococcales bacterium]|nr:acyl carrier protein [Magnetococcales bacterium]
MPDTDSAKQQIREEIQRLATASNNDASDITDDDIIPVLGVLDSMDLLRLISWYEKTFHLNIPEDEITIDNFGTINAMATYALDRADRGAA